MTEKLDKIDIPKGYELNELAHENAQRHRTTFFT
jgi:hypothetical protein